MVKYKLMIGIIAILVFVLSSCASQEVTCNSPYIKVGTSCCLDQNSNKICDKDEVKDTSQRIEAKEQPNITTEKVVDKKELAEKTALRFARYGEKKDLGNMYDLFISDLKNLKSKERFVNLFFKHKYLATCKNQVFTISSSSNRDSMDTFRRGIKRIFNLQHKNNLIKKFYEQVRCGLFHDGMTRKLVAIDGNYKKAITLSHKSIKINPYKFLSKIEQDFDNYISDLKDNKNNQLKQNFKNFLKIR